MSTVAGCGHGGRIGGDKVCNNFQGDQATVQQLRGGRPLQLSWKYLPLRGRAQESCIREWIQKWEEKPADRKRHELMGHCAKVKGMGWVPGTSKMFKIWVKKGPSSGFGLGRCNQRGKQFIMLALQPRL